MFLTFLFSILFYCTMLQTTKRNTDMLNAVANLTEMKLNLTRELNFDKGETSEPNSKHSTNA